MKNKMKKFFSAGCVTGIDEKKGGVILFRAETATTDVVSHQTDVIHAYASRCKQQGKEIPLFRT